MTEQQKQRIDHYVQIYLNAVQSVSNDAGFETYSILARLIDFKGDLPPPSGNDQSNLGMMRSIQLLRERHAKMPVISAAVRCLLSTKNDQMLALLAKHFYTGVCPYTDKPWNNSQRAGEIGQELYAFENNLKRAYQSFQAEIEAAERYREYFGLAC